MPFGSPESLLTRCDLMANPTTASRCSSFLRPLQKKVKPAPTSFKSPSSARRLTQSCDLDFESVKFSTN